MPNLDEIFPEPNVTGKPWHRVNFLGNPFPHDMAGGRPVGEKPTLRVEQSAFANGHLPTDMERLALPADDPVLADIGLVKFILYSSVTGERPGSSEVTMAAAIQVSRRTAA